MSKTLHRFDAKMDNESPPLYAQYSPPARLYLRPDCFGLRSFVPPDELDAAVGDLVQIDRVLYTDWALYAGNGNVVHVAGLHTDGSDIPMDAAGVRLSSLGEVAGAGCVRVNNKIVGAKERGLEPLPVDDVIHNAYSCLDKEVEFNMLTRNSEHYVTEWKYGQGWSDQATVTMNVMKTLSSDFSVGHSILVSGLNEVLNSPGSPVGRTTPSFALSPVKEKH